MPAAFPAVTVPSFIKAGRKAANFSSELTRGCSSTEK
jgi:hypothetical protein